MNDRKLDALFINADSSAKAYQDLAREYSAIEPPTWSLLLAESCRAKGWGVGILDCDAERLSLEASVSRIEDAAPRLAVFVVYGQNPNSGTTSMIGALLLARALKAARPDIPICFVGSHVSALPREVLAEDCVDLVLLNEGVYALHDLLRGDLASTLADTRGIGYKPAGGPPAGVLNPPQGVVPQARMDIDLPGYAWDLLPYREKPLDLYRAHFWHAGFNHANRTPFAAIYTSLGCNFGCDFCMINIINRVDNGDEVSAAESRGMRYWSDAWVQRQLETLARMGVQTVRISDEMFFLNKKYYAPLLQGIIDRDLQFKLWAYARVDTIREDQLALFKRAGVDWLAVGIEAGNQAVRHEVSKGSFKDVNIRDICATVRQADINIIGNYIFGFPEDTLQTMQETLDLALELNTEMANMYPCQALPGSPIHRRAKQLGWPLPENFEQYAFLSYECVPLPTRHLSAAEVLAFRDRAWQTYFSHPPYLDLVERRFGLAERQNVEKMASIKLKRRLLGD